MPMERLTMRKIREVLRLKWEAHLSNTKIALSCAISRESVRNYLDRANKAQLSWPLPEELDDGALEALLFPSSLPPKQSGLPDWRWVHRELKKRGVTRLLLWEEYAHGAEVMSYSRFCYLYRQYQATLDPVMRQAYKAGEVVFVDYTGMTLEYADKETGELFEAEIFVATLGASSYTFAEASRSQQLPDWVNSHVRAFHYFGGVPEVLVPDNLKSGVTKAHRYDPEVNPTYQELANHYAIAVVPARANAPKDKAKVEANVRGIEQRILAKLRNRTFFSIADINTAIAPLLEAYNAKAFQKMPGSRLSEFQDVDQPALKSLPKYPYEYAQWKKARVGIDYHVAFEYHYYSVPYQYLKQEVQLRITHSCLQCFVKDKLIATHQRAYRKGFTTIEAHMPKAHREYAHWTPERIIQWAKETGEHTSELIRAMIDSRPQPQQAFRACLGVMRLGQQCGADRLEKAAIRALALGALSYKSIESILKHGLEDQPLPQSSTQSPAMTHEHVRGSDYYDESIKKVSGE